MRVLMLPHPTHFRTEESGIKRVVLAYAQHLPQFGVQLVAPGEDYDIKAVHAGTAPDTDVCHCHGLYWTADYPANQWEWKANHDVIRSIREAREVTVPSNWVAETFQRDMRFTPHVIGHGIDWDDWAHHNAEKGDYVLWNKNRMGDVCDPMPIINLAKKFTKGHFVSTFAPRQGLPGNINVIGVVPHDQMKRLIQSCLVYLATTKETFGIGTLEAMASGVPVLGYRHGGTVDLIKHGVNGYLAEPGNIKDLENGLRYCIAHHDMLGENGREMARAYTWENACEQVAEVYRKAMKEREGKSTCAVIIPSWNYADKVGDAVESVINQSYEKLTDIIVVDDGSQDDGATEIVIGEWSEQDNRVRYVHKDNGGVATARNRGIEEVDTEYVCCLDADDAIGPDFISACVEELEKNPMLGIAYSGLWYIKPNGETGLSPWPDNYDYDEFVGDHPLNQIPTCCVFRREMWEKLGGYRQRYAPQGAGEEDAEFWLRCGAYGWDAKLIDGVEDFQTLYANLKRGLKREPTRDDVVNHGVSADFWNTITRKLFYYSWLSGRVSGAESHAITDWRGWHPWVKDNQHPFASMAKPKNGWSHPVRQYDEPIVSVIIPVGPGHESDVINALDSLEAQTLRRWEAILAWDSDDDPSENLQIAYPYIKLAEYKGTHGAGYARNRGVELARAPFLFFLDADDTLYPQALKTMLEAWENNEQIIYSDYVGKAYIGNPNELASDLQERIKYYNDKTGESVIGYRAFDFDCERAQAQPVGDGSKPYIWCNISCLVPKAWHVEIGGFDESMPSWEDWDYWIRMARAGHCFHRVEEELLVYRFYTGGRREKGKEIYAELIQYLQEKYTEGDIKMCSSCGKSKRRMATPISRSVPIQHTQAVQQMNDTEWILCIYKHRNRGQHMVIGATIFDRRMEGVPMIHNRGGWKIKYQYHGGGDKFLVHAKDIQNAPHLFEPVKAGLSAPKVEEKPLEAPQPIVQAVPVPDRKTPTPESIVSEPPLPAVELSNDEVSSIIESSDEAIHSVRDARRTAKPKKTGTEFDLQTLPGINADIAAQLRDNEIYVKEDILELGYDGLMKYKGIGKKKATMIIGAIEAMNA